MSSQEFAKPPYIQTTVRLSPEEYEALKKFAYSEHRSISGQVRHWILKAAGSEA